LRWVLVRLTVVTAVTDPIRIVVSLRGIGNQGAVVFFPAKAVSVTVAAGVADIPATSAVPVLLTGV
jgi:hypothetical protein